MQTSGTAPQFSDGVRKTIRVPAVKAAPKAKPMPMKGKSMPKGKKGC